MTDFDIAMSFEIPHCCFMLNPCLDATGQTQALRDTFLRTNHYNRCGCRCVKFLCTKKNEAAPKSSSAFHPEESVSAGTIFYQPECRVIHFPNELKEPANRRMMIAYAVSNVLRRKLYVHIDFTGSSSPSPFQCAVHF